MLTAPVVGVLALLIRRHDGGPPLIRVTRVGRSGRPVRMWKLRSMRADRPDGSADGSALTGELDRRITPIGRRLRAYHLDELPQLWNVARGEMLLLGPRPEAPEFVDHGCPQWAEILSVPPGIAGPTQVIVSDWERTCIADDDDGDCYRRDVLPVKLAIDRWYLRSASPTNDLLVGVTLLRRFLPGTESWTLKRRVFSEVPEAAPVRDWLRARAAERRAATRRDRPVRPRANAHRMTGKVGR